MSEQEEVVEIMARALLVDAAARMHSGDIDFREVFRAEARAVITALEAKGYTISRSRHGIVHGQEPFKGE
jgi:hypothetical protein